MGGCYSKTGKCFSEICSLKTSSNQLLYMSFLRKKKTSKPVTPKGIQIQFEADSSSSDSENEKPKVTIPIPRTFEVVKETKQEEPANDEPEIHTLYMPSDKVHFLPYYQSNFHKVRKAFAKRLGSIIQFSNFF
jgi:hypothetical protein